MRLKKDDFLKFGFTEGCPGCRAIISGTVARGHHEACRRRMQEALAGDDQGRERLGRQNAKEDDYLTRVLEKRFGQEDAERRALDAKKARTMDETGTKRTQEGEEEEGAREQ